MLTYLIWHYSSGLQGFLKIWGNYLAFFAHYFSLGLLLKTLISPWHRDVTLTNWRGFHPLLTLQKFVNNIFSRFMGMLVRIFYYFCADYRNSDFAFWNSYIYWLVVCAFVFCLFCL